MRIIQRALAAWQRNGVAATLIALSWAFALAGVAGAVLFDFGGSAERASLWVSTATTPTSSAGGIQLKGNASGNLLVSLGNAGYSTPPVHVAVIGNTTLTAGGTAPNANISGTSTIPAFAAMISDGSTTWNMPLRPAAVGDANANCAGCYSNGMYAFNGTGHDRWRSNVDLTALTSSARTSTTNSADLVNYNGRGVTCMLDLTAHVGASLQMGVQWKDPVSSSYSTLALAPTAHSTTGNVSIRLYPGVAAASAPIGLAATSTYQFDLTLPRTYRVQVVHNNANSSTYSVGCSNEV